MKVIPRDILMGILIAVGLWLPYWVIFYKWYMGL